MINLKESKFLKRVTILVTWFCMFKSLSQGSKSLKFIVNHKSLKICQSLFVKEWVEPWLGEGKQSVMSLIGSEFIH